jgi:hypothetical protein
MSKPLPRKPALDPMELRRMFLLNIPTGDLFWRNSKRGGWNLKRAGYFHEGNGGYERVGIGKEQYPVHQIVFAMMHGRWPERDVDHINGKRRDNRPANLREATVGETRTNRATPRTNKSGHKWVSWDTDSGKWLVRVVGYGRVFKARFTRFEQACEIACAKAKELQGDFYSVRAV